MQYTSQREMLFKAPLIDTYGNLDFTYVLELGAYTELFPKANRIMHSRYPIEYFMDSVIFEDLYPEDALEEIEHDWGIQLLGESFKEQCNQFPRYDYPSFERQFVKCINSFATRYMVLFNRILAFAEEIHNNRHPRYQYGILRYYQLDYSRIIVTTTPVN